MISGSEIYKRATVLHFIVVRSSICPPPEIYHQMKENGVADDIFDSQLIKIFKEIEQKMKDIGVIGNLSPIEKQWMNLPISEYTKYPIIASHWRKESLAMLLWALGIWEDPEVDVEVTEEKIKEFTPRKLGLFEKVETRPNDVISRQREKYELWHWRVRTQKLINENYKFEPNQAMIDQGFTSFDAIVRQTTKLSGSDTSLRLNVIDEDFGFLNKPFRELNEQERNQATSIIMERHFALNWICGMSKGNKWDDTPTET